MKRILVIEDEEALREEIVTILGFEDFDVVSAADGAEGVTLASETAPDLIICDVMMPKLDGFGVLDALQHDPANANTPFVFLTAKADKKDRRQGMEMGADDYVTKPFSHEELLSAIRIRLEKHAAARSEAKKDIDALRRNLAHALPHELRTPLFGIMGYASLLKTSAAAMSAEDIAETGDWIMASSERLQRLIENYLLYAKLEMWAIDPDAKDALHMERVPAADLLIAETVDQLAAIANRERDLLLNLAEAPVAMAEDHLRKIARELVDNAFKFSTSGLPVTVTSRIDGDRYILSVNDCGRGMTAEAIRRVGAYMQFEREAFEQQGSGMGLALSARLAELYGGELTITSEPGRGTQVIAVLPLGA